MAPSQPAFGLSSARHPFVLAVAIWIAASLPSDSAASDAAPLEVERGDTIVIIGNTLAERMAMCGHWEPLLHARFPDHQLTVRNLGWSADEIDLRPRSKDSDQHGHELADHKPDILIAMFGLNESFAGPEGLPAFRQSLERFVRTTTSTAYNGDHPPHLILCSPTPHEDLHRPELPDGSQTNANIERYLETMREVAAAFPDQCRFVDLYHPLRPKMDDAASDLTINGIHLNDAGYQHLASILDQALFGAAVPVSSDKFAALRAAVLERNTQFYYDYRAVNGYYIYGGRKNPYGVVNFPAEFAKLRKMIAVRDQRIWDIARGHEISETIDDSGTGELPPVESNVAGPLEVTTPEQSLERFTVPEGFIVELVASEVEFPDLQNPVAMEFDNAGRLWISTMPSYPMYLPGTPPDDKILIFEDLDQDGRMDKQTVFADGLHLPIGFVLGDGGAYVSAQPNLMFLQDTDGDDVADQQSTILHGFDSADSHHSISAFTWGPGGAMYFQEGTFHHTQVETPYGPRRVKDAAVFRYEPKTEKFDIFVSYPFANPWGHCFDRWGQNFVADASPGANYFGTAFSGDVIYPHKRRGMNQFLEKQWRPTCGCVIVSSRNFPDEMQGNYLLNNTIGFLGTLQYKMREEGSGFAADPVEPLLRSSDPNFRPVDLAFGPDGALYIVDWFNPLIGHMQHNLRDPNRDKHHGRIWRVRYEGRPLVTPPKIAGAPLEDLVPLLGEYEDATRAAVRNELRGHATDEVVAALDDWLADVETGSLEAEVEHAHLEALWVLQHHDRVDRERLLRVMDSPDGRARAAATRVLGYWRDRIDGSTDLLVRAASDPHPRVRLEAVRAASFLAPEDGHQVVAAAMRHPLDYYLNYTIGETTTTLERRGGTSPAGPGDMADALASSLVPQPQLVSSVRLAARGSSPQQLGKIVDGILNGPYESSVRAEAIEEIHSAASVRKIQPTPDAVSLVRAFNEAVRSDRAELAEILATVAGQWQILGSEGALETVVFDPEADGRVVQAALVALTKFNTAASSDAIGALQRENLPLELRQRAAAALASSRPEPALRMFRSALAEGAEDYELIRLVVRGWLGQQGGADQLASGLATVDMPADTAKLVLRAVSESADADPKLVELLRQHAGLDGSEQPLSEAQRQELIRRIDTEGDPVAGQWVYRREDLSCIKCHALRGAGGNIGPDLSGVGATSPTEYLLDSILRPSQQIKEAYATRNILTVDGQIVRGVQVDRDSERLVLRDAEGRDITVPVADIEEEAEGPSLMPEGLHHQMTQREMIDLVAFLAALGKPGPFELSARPTLPFYQYLDDAAVAERLASLDEGALEQQLPAIAQTAWTAAYPLVDGTLPLDAILEEQPPLPVILRGNVEVVVGGEVAVRVSPPQDAQVVVDGRSVAAHGGEAIELEPGQHHVYVIYERARPAGGIQVEVLRAPESKAEFTLSPGPSN